MSVLADICCTLSSDNLKEKLTLEERAELLYEITTDLGWETYVRYDEKGNRLFNLEKAKEALQRYG